MAVPKLQYAIGNSSSTTLSVAASNSDTTFTLTSDTNFAAKSGAGMVIVDEGQATEEVAYSASKSGSALSVPLVNRGLEGGSAQAHAINASVKGILTAGMWNDLIDSVANVLDSTTGAVKSFSMPTAGSINDANGNELIKFPATVTSPLNEITVYNAATTASPVIQSSGETNVGLDIKMKGTGKFRKPSIIGLQVVDAATNTATGDGKAFFRVPAELNGMNLTGVAASVYTAGTTGTTDIQLRNKTDSQDMLSVKLTIDSAETDTSTAATAATINTSYDDVATGDIIAVDVDAISTTPAQGLYVEMRFELPA